MKKVYYFIFTVVFLFIFSQRVSADYGDLVYDVTNVSVYNDRLTIEGYAFIHKTNNYVTVYKRDAKGLIKDSDGNPIVVAQNGGQKVKIKASSGSLSKEVEYIAVDPYDSSLDIPDYNFFYRHYWAGPGYGSFDDEKDGGYYYYNNSDGASKDCKNGYGACYYEDIYFKITFTYDQLKQLGNNDISFDIAVCNNSYGCSDYESLKIPLNDISIRDNDYFELTSSLSNGKAKFVAIDATINPAVRTSSYVRNVGDTGNYYNIVDTSDIGRMETSANKDWLQGVRGLYSYPICVSPSSSANGKAKNACIDIDANSFCKSCRNGKIYYAFGSYLDFEGFSQLKFKIKNENKCEPVVPSSGDLNCNNSKNFNSICEELVVSTSEGTATVKIEQKGTISSVLTPDKTYVGGGFNFGIMYYNTIKWTYAQSVPNSDLHAAINDAMNDKLKDYNSYVAGLNITGLKLGNELIDSSFMVKQCRTSSESKNYYNSELTVSCIFYFPNSDILMDGNVNYTAGIGSGISNKYYTSLDYIDKYNTNIYKIEANIEGMDRITSVASFRDSKEEGKAWTGNWSDTFKGCDIDLYPLLIKNGRANYIYRPIDIYNPFPNRNAGINWFDWYNVQRNKDRLKNTYSELQFVATLDNHIIANIKNYNKSHNYLEWNSIDVETGDSSFITENNYVDRVGGNS